MAPYYSFFSSHNRFATLRYSLFLCSSTCFWFSHLITNSFHSKDSTTRAEREMYAFENSVFGKLADFEWSESSREEKNLSLQACPRADSIMEISFIVYFPFSELYMERGKRTRTRTIIVCTVYCVYMNNCVLNVSKSMLFMYDKATMTWNAIFKCYKFHNFAP